MKTSSEFHKIWNITLALNFCLILVAVKFVCTVSSVMTPVGDILQFVNFVCPVSWVMARSVVITSVPQACLHNVYG
jgi:hypothetical protein